MTADKILHCGTVLTMDPAGTRATSVALSGGKIVAVGFREAMDAHRGPSTEIVELPGFTLAPGFIEAHGHPFWSAQIWGDPVVDIRAIHVPTYQAALAKILRRVEKAKEGEVLWFLGLDPQLHQGMEEPSRQLLDELAPNHAIVVQTSNFHAAYVNSKAAMHFGLEDERQTPLGGQVVRDEQGRAWKLLEMAAWKLSDRFNELVGAERQDANLQTWIRKFVDAGYTTSSEILLAPGMAPVVARRLDKLPRSLRVVGYEAVAAGGPVSVEKDYSLGMFSMAGVKFHADGSVLLGNVWTSSPYLNNEMTLKGMGLPKDNTGHALYDFETLYTKVTQYARDGRQISAHAHGDRTIDLVLDVYERVLGEQPAAAGPFRLEHCGLMRDDQIDRALRIGVVASYFLPYIYHWGEALRDYLLGPEAAARFVPAGSAIKRGMRVSFHCDSPMTWPDALKCLHVAVTRRTLKGAVIGEEQRVPIEKALRAVTIDAAYHLRMDHLIGSIEVGKAADFVVLGGDPLSWDAERLMEIPIVDTYVEGRSTRNDLRLP